jgi:hypothetical protein
MAKFIIADENNDSMTADVLKSGALEVAPVYTNYFMNSGTASGIAVAAPCYLHTVTIQSTAVKGQLYLGNQLLTASASAIGGLTSAGLIAKIDLAARGSYLFDSIVENNLIYRLTGLDCDGITLTYQLA